MDLNENLHVCYTSPTVSCHFAGCEMYYTLPSKEGILKLLGRFIEFIVLPAYMYFPDLDML